MDTQTILIDYITKELSVGRAKQIRPSDNLLETGVLDSLGLMQLVIFIEEKLGLKVPDEDVVIENFSSVDALTGYLERMKKASP
jgi:acyl carrier protein